MSENVVSEHTCVLENQIKTLGVYTTIYPGVERYLHDWYRSLQLQSDPNYQLWIALDEVSVDDAIEAMGSDPKATWIAAEPGDTPAMIRQRALERIVNACDGVVLVDSDDILHPSRVGAARETLRTSDLSGCALRLVDQVGRDLQMTLTAPATPDSVFPRNNVYGLSNSSFRTELLRRCLPIPSTVVVVDWFLATRAWLIGATLSFDPVVRMDYRQHDRNMVRVRSPFNGLQISSDTKHVLQHFKLVRESSTNGVVAGRLQKLSNVASEVESFYRKVVCQPIRLERYVEALNALHPMPLWWSGVANPSLQRMWVA